MEETEWEEVIMEKNDNVSVFPPMNHENLPPQPPDSTIVDESEESEEEGKSEGVRRSIKMRMEIVRSKVLWVSSRIGFGYLVSGSVTTLMLAALLLYYKVQRRRWKLKEMGFFQLLQQKDKRIRQLLLQIAEMKEMLLTPRRVPIYRVLTQNYFKY